MKIRHRQVAHGVATKCCVKETSHARMAAPANPDRDVLKQMIAAAAFRRAELRGFAPGREIDDWLAAEGEIDAAMATMMH